MAGRARSTVIVLSAAAATLALLDIRGGVITDGIRNAGAVMMGPLQQVSAALANPAIVWIQSTYAFSSSEQRAELWREQAPELAAARADARLAELDALLGRVSLSQLSVVPARVVAYPSNPLDLTNVVIDLGSSSGIATDQAVITGDGVVGRTTSVSIGSTDVKLISAPDSAIGGRFARTGQSAIVLGTGDPSSLSVRVVDPTADVQLGDVVVTFGSKDSRPFPPDLPIGIVAAIDDDGAGGRIIRLRPAANLGGLDLVGVVMPIGATSSRPLVNELTPPTTSPSPQVSEPVPSASATAGSRPTTNKGASGRTTPSSAASPASTGSGVAR